MRKGITWALVCMFVAVSLVACGGGGNGGDATPAHVPVISNLTISPQSATLNQGGGAVAVTMTYQFADAGADVSTFTASIYDSKGTLLDTGTVASAASGHTSGTLTLSGITIPTTTAMTYTLQVFLTDATGAESNKLSGTFVVGGGAISAVSIMSQSNSIKQQEESLMLENITIAPTDENFKKKYLQLKEIHDSLAN